LPGGAIQVDQVVVAVADVDAGLSVIGAFDEQGLSERDRLVILSLRVLGAV
jgi:hypothetical protein